MAPKLHQTHHKKREIKKLYVYVNYNVQFSQFSGSEYQLAYVSNRKLKENTHWKHGVNRRITDHQKTLVKRHRAQVKDAAKHGLHCGNNQTAMDHKL